MTTDNATTPNQDEREALVQLIVDHEPRKGFQAHEIFNLADAILAANFHRNVGAVSVEDEERLTCPNNQPGATLPEREPLQSDAERRVTEVVCRTIARGTPGVDCGCEGCSGQFWPLAKKVVAALSLTNPTEQWKEAACWYASSGKSVGARREAFVAGASHAAEFLHFPSPSPSVVTTVEDVERVLGISLWNAESFRGDVRIDFNEYGQILEVELLPTSPPPSEVRVTGEALPEIAHKGSSTDAEMFERMAWNLDNDYPAGGSNARNALSRLIRREIRRAAGIPVAGEES